MPPAHSFHKNRARRWKNGLSWFIGLVPPERRFGVRRNYMPASRESFALPGAQLSQKPCPTRAQSAQRYAPQPAHGWTERPLILRPHRTHSISDIVIPPPADYCFHGRRFYA